MLDALRPYLKFTPKPLDVYTAESGMEAETRQLPTWENGDFRAFNPTRVDGIAPTQWTNGTMYEQFGVLPKSVKVVDLEAKPEPTETEKHASDLANDASARRISGSSAANARARKSFTA